MSKKEFDILKTISYAGTMDVLFAITNGKNKFTDIMFETELNPGILNRLLKSLLVAKMIDKDTNGYHMTDKGAKIVMYALQIIDIDGESESHKAIKELLSGKLKHTVKA
jgi:predicted transcriptional regulator